MIEIAPNLKINESEIQFEFIHASGPGGQNVNKVSSAVQLRFDIRNSPSLDLFTKERLIKLSGNRVTEDGILIIEAKRYRTQEQNKWDALMRLSDLIQQAMSVPKSRHPTKPSAATREKRLKAKHHRSQIKAMRKFRIGENE
ncbi:MAG: alternative ribosome rescue aminoacyl-tRNA hydrolase ArfB [Anaerolineales bacterium]